MKRYDGDVPVNARIKIDYSKDKPKVSFSYPRKKSQARGSMFRPILYCWIILNMMLYLYLCFFVFNQDTDILKNYPFKTINEFNKTDYNSFKEYYTQEERINYYYGLSNDSDIKRLSYSFKNIFTSREIFFLIYFFGGWIVIYYPFKKKWDKLYPDYQALTSSKKIAKFKSKDVIDNIDKTKYPYYVELPVFSNIVCDFNAEKDFSKYMKEFEIREHKLGYFRKKKVKIGKNKRKEHRVNEFLWYARWYFSEKPKTGNLEVIFK